MGFAIFLLFFLLAMIAFRRQKSQTELEHEYKVKKVSTFKALLLGFVTWGILVLAVLAGFFLYAGVSLVEIPWIPGVFTSFVLSCLTLKMSKEIILEDD